MKRTIITLIALVTLSALPLMAGGEELSLSWDHGIRLTSADRTFALKIGGRIMSDWASFSADREVEDAYGKMDDGTEFRRARLYFAGTIYGNVEFKAQYDFGGGDADFKDVYIGLKKVFGNVGLRIGHFKEPFSLEEQISSKYITFMERAMTGESFSPGRNDGFMLHSATNRLAWGIGAFKDANSYGTGEDNVSESNWALTGRIAGTLYYRDKGASLLHLGLAITTRDPIDDEVRFRTRPEMHMSPHRFVDTHTLQADGDDRYGVEFALVQGPFSLQGEYMQASVDLLDGDSADLSSYYVYASFFLTGEHRKYKKGAFGRVSPHHNFAPGEGAGAWEIALRYSSVDYNDGPVTGGEEDNITLGVNWYLNPNTRFMWNYVHADITDLGNVDTFMMRFQVDF